MAQSLSNLPIGARVKFGKHSVNGETPQPIVWQVVNQSSSSITLLSSQIIDLRAMDAKESTNPTSLRASYGNGYYPHSNISQWLNSSAASNWYVAQHEYDAPPSNDNITGGTPYSQRPGFLYHFSDSERNAILYTTIRCIHSYVEGSGYDDIRTRVFLPSLTELNGSQTNQISEGSKWAFFNSWPSLVCTVTDQLVENTTVSSPPSKGSARTWWTRTNPYSFPERNYYIDTSGNSSYSSSYSGSTGIRPALNLSPTQSVSDTTDSSGAYTLVLNNAPPVPITLNVPTTIYGGTQITISWSGVTDPDGHTVTYQLERSLNGGAYEQIYSGSNLSYITTIAKGVTSVQFRLRATDSLGASSGYITSTSRTVINNTAPTISGSDGNLGEKKVAFTQTYTIGDADGNPVTVTEAIDGTPIRSYVATLGATNTFSVTSTTWISLTNGPHTMTITATDGGATTVRTYTFTKSVSEFAFRNSTPFPASTKPVRIKVTVDREIPTGATFKVEVCRNGYDGDNQVWEDATSSVIANQAHVFQREIDSPSGGKWGVFVRVTVNRNGKSGACYVKSIGGNFE